MKNILLITFLLFTFCAFGQDVNRPKDAETDTTGLSNRIDAKADTSAAALLNTYNEFLKAQELNGILAKDSSFVFNGKADEPWEQYKMWVDSELYTLNFATEITDVVLQIGQELYVRVVNKLGETISNGSVVYVSGALGNRPTVGYADANIDSTVCRLIGVSTHDIADNQEGLITVYGVVRNLNTSSYNTGDRLFVSVDSGMLTDTLYESPISHTCVAVVLSSHLTQGEILVKPVINGKLDNLNDVHFESLSNNEVILYDSIQGRWENITLPHNYLDSINVDTNYQHITLDQKNNLALKNDTNTFTKQTTVQDIEIQGSVTGAGALLTNLTSDITTTGKITGDYFYGQIYTNTGVTKATTVTGTYYTITGLTTNGSSNTTLTDSTITIDSNAGGLYEIIFYSNSATHSSSNTILHISVFIDDVESKIEGERKIGTGGDLGSFSAGGIVVLNGNEVIKCKVKADNTGTATLGYFIFTVKRL